ncbi:MAG: hypothetical protein AAB583_05695 [Patescibacteria group bacterium]
MGLLFNSFKQIDKNLWLNIAKRSDLNPFSIPSAFPTILSPLLMSSTSLFYGVTSVAKNSLLQKEFRDEQRTTMGSLDAFAGNLFYAMVAFLLGFVADILSPAKGLLIIQILLIPVLFIYWKLLKYKE